MPRYYEDDYGFPEYVPVAEKKRRNQRSAAKLRKNNQNVQPVIIEGRKIASTWWGSSWNANLERYADYSNRIGRGRSYVRHGAVLDLQIQAGQVTALVQGSRSRPYKVEIKIKPLAKATWKRLRETALTRLDSLADLLAGKFPETLREAFFARGDGLFPTPREIKFNCSCPDWASMCKHVAAVLYGIGSRLDLKPEMLFELRRVEMAELIAKTVDATAEKWLEIADDAHADDVLQDSDIAGVFGIELEEGDVSSGDSLGAPNTGTSPVKARPKIRGKSKKKQGKIETGTNAAAKPASKKRTASSRTVTVNSKPAGKKKKGDSAAKISGQAKPPVGFMVEQMAAAAPRGRRGFDIRALGKKLPSWSDSQVRNTLQRALREGALERVARGLYRLPRNSG